LPASCLAKSYDVYPGTKKWIVGTPTFIVASNLRFIGRIRSSRELSATDKVECCDLVDVMIAAEPLTLEPSAWPVPRQCAIVVGRFNEDQPSR
jgi:hypothetical protein